MSGCELCGYTMNLQRCSICKVALYCCRDHQKKHWTEHQKHCKRPNLDVPAFSIPTHQADPDSVRFLNDSYTISGTSSDYQFDLPDDFYTQLISSSASTQETEYESEMSVLNSLSQALGIFPSPVPSLPQTQVTQGYEAGGAVNQESRLIPYPLRHSNFASNVSELGEAEVMKVRCQYLINDLDKYGICVMDDFLGQQWAKTILNDVQCLYNEGNFKDGKVVKNTSGRPTAVIRGDKTLEVTGLEKSAGNIKKLMQVVDEVVIRSSRYPNNGKMGAYSIQHRTKAMVAVYPGHDSKYVKHVDNPHKDGRCITSIYYLNENWNSKEDGGLLRIFPTEWNGKVADIEPLFDRMVFFWSDRRNPHEVQPSKKIRYAITLWYFDYPERSAYERQQLTQNRASSGAPSFNGTS